MSYDFKTTLPEGAMFSFFPKFPLGREVPWDSLVTSLRIYL